MGPAAFERPCLPARCHTFSCSPLTCCPDLVHPCASFPFPLHVPVQRAKRWRHVGGSSRARVHPPQPSGRRRRRRSRRRARRIRSDSLRLQFASSGVRPVAFLVLLQEVQNITCGLGHLRSPRSGPPRPSAFPSRPGSVARATAGASCRLPVSRVLELVVTRDAYRICGHDKKRAKKLETQVKSHAGNSFLI